VSAYDLGVGWGPSGARVRRLGGVSGGTPLHANAAEVHFSDFDVPAASARWLFAGGDIGFMRANGSPSTNTTAANRDTSYTDAAIAVVGSTAFTIADFYDDTGASDFAEAGDDLWCHAYWRNFGAAGTGNHAELRDATDQPWLALRQAGSSTTVGLYYNSGTGGSPTWTLIGSTFSVTATASHTFDINLVIDAAGTAHFAEVFVDNASKSSGTFSQASLTEIHSFACGGVHGSGQAYSEFLASIGYPTIGSHVYYGKPTGSGTSSQWTGAYTAVDDAGINDSDFISSSTNGHISTFAINDVPTLTGSLALGDIFYTVRARSSVPGDYVKPAKRIAGSTTSDAAFASLTTSFVTRLIRYDPVSETDWNSIEFGVENAGGPAEVSNLKAFLIVYDGSL